MIVLDRYFQVDKVGNFATWIGIADLHLLCPELAASISGIPKKDLAADEDFRSGGKGFQPLDRDGYNYFRYCVDEIKRNPKYYGKPITYTAGDNTELERSSVRKVKRSGLRKNDNRADDTLHKHNLNRYVIPKIHGLIKGTDFVGGVAGNHMIEFADSTGYRNSEEYIIKRLKGVYCGEAMMVVNCHVRFGKSQRRIIRVVVQHGSRGGSKNAVIKELQSMYALFGEVHMLVKAHAHDPMTAFYARYEIPDSGEEKKMRKQETLVMCLGATRDGIKLGYDDYCERALFAPSASRFPMAIFHACRLAETGGRLEVKIRPITM